MQFANLQPVACFFLFFVFVEPVRVPLVCYAGLLEAGSSMMSGLGTRYAGIGPLAVEGSLKELRICWIWEFGTVSSYNLVIDRYCKNGDFRDVMLVFNWMRGKN